MWALIVNIKLNWRIERRFKMWLTNVLCDSNWIKEIGKVEKIFLIKIYFYKRKNGFSRIVLEEIPTSWITERKSSLQRMPGKKF